MPTDLATAKGTNLTHMFLLQDYEVKLQEIQALQEEKKVHVHESSVGPSSTTNPKPREDHPTAAQANLCQSCKRQIHLGA